MKLVQKISVSFIKIAFLSIYPLFLAAIGKLITEQRLAFDYKFYQKDFDVKVNCLIISQGEVVFRFPVSIRFQESQFCHMIFQ